MKAILLALVGAAAAADRLQIGVTHKVAPELCDRKTTNGDMVQMHYIGTLEDGTEFDQLYKRGQPLGFQLGARQVIEGWEQGLMGMCVGEKRRLRVPPDLAYGERSVGSIPGGSTLIFDVELVSIETVDWEQRVYGDEL